MSGKIIAIAVVAVLVVAGVGVGIYVATNNNDSGTKAIKGTSVEVYGNANNDYYINDSDIDKIKEIIKKNSDDDASNDIDWKKDFPFADATANGTVDDADVEQVEKIMKATPEEQVVVKVRCYYKETPYVSDVRYPIVKSFANSNQTTVILLKTLGIDEEIQGMSYYYTVSGNKKNADVDTTAYDNYIFKDYFDVMVKSRQCGLSTADFTNDPSKELTALGCTAYVMSASNGEMAAIKYAHDTLKYDIVELRDGSGNANDYNSAVLTLGFLFGQKYLDKAVEYVNWMADFADELNDYLSKVGTGDVKKLSGAASSSTTSVSVKGSSNITIIEEAGFNCPVSSKDSSSGQMTEKYDYANGDRWLNYIALDTFVILKGSTTSTKIVDEKSVKYNWSWFDKDYSTASIPQSFKDHMDLYSSLACYNDEVVLSTMLPGPLKSGALANYFYKDVFPENWIQDKAGEFLQKFWGFTEEQTQGQQYVLSKAVVMGS